jgi:glycosyltransferase involved in cell wall biosynthesis
VINDGGEDVSDTLARFEGYFPITYVRNTVAAGRTAALNTGVERSRTNWIAFLDDDDILYPSHFDTLWSAVQENPGSLFFYSNYNRALLKSRLELFPLVTTGVEPFDYNRRKLLLQNYIPIHTWLVAHECFDRVGCFETRMLMLEDYEFLLRLSRIIDFHHVQRFTCEYRFYLDGVNSMATQREKTLDALKHIFDANPVEDPQLAREREYHLIALRDQISRIRDLQEANRIGTGDKTELYLRILNLITGF